jgi:ribosomal protein S18 acetylase RimI-like enzyme
MLSRFYQIFLVFFLICNSAFAAKPLDYCLSPSAKSSETIRFEMMEGEDFFNDTQIWELYDRSFSEDEKVAIEKFRNYLTMKNTRGSMIRLVENNQSIGLMYYTLREKLSLAFVGYLAVDSKFQGKGYGKALFKCGMETSKLQFRSEGRESIGMVLEVEKPETAEHPHDRLKREGILKFYQKFNRIILPVDYRQPALSENQKEIPMFLLHIPHPEQQVDKSNELANKILDTVMSEIYSKSSSSK